MSAIAVDGLCHRYGDLVAVDDVSFQIAAGEVVSLLGPNGAGKTTMLEVLEGYMAPTAGRVSVLGAEPRRAGRQWRARIGVVLQTCSLDPQLRVREALSVFARLFARPRPVSQVLELIGLDGDAETRIGQLSGGQQRRVDLGLGLIGRPELLFLDEPTTGLDPAARRAMWAVVRQLARDGTTVLFSTHYMEEAQELAERLLVLNGGRLVADAPPDALRAAARRSTVRLPLPEALRPDDLPVTLAVWLPQGQLAGEELELAVDAASLDTVLDQLLDWARAHGIDLAGLQVAPPSLEDTYLQLTAGHDERGGIESWQPATV